MCDDETDEAIMSRLAAGDDLALNPLIARWKGRVASFLHRVTGDHVAAVDLAQETFVKLYQSRKRYTPKGKFSSYLFAIASNLVRNHARWTFRHPTVALDDQPEPEALDPGPTPEEAAQSAEKLAFIRQAFQKLPRQLREAMALFVHEGMGYAEISAIAGCSPKAAETRIYRARQLLKQKLEGFRPDRTSTQ